MFRDGVDVEEIFVVEPVDSSNSIWGCGGGGFHSCWILEFGIGLVVDVGFGVDVKLEIQYHFAINSLNFIATVSEDCLGTISRYVGFMMFSNRRYYRSWRSDLRL